MVDTGDDDNWFAEDEADAPRVRLASAPWKILIVDDDSEVHAVTRLILKGATFQDRPILFLSAHSGAEARQVIAETPDIAVILLDVVMETDDAGLRVARFVREEAGNPHVRIILRTGQPGQAPERAVIDGYEIDDYKAKSELTADKLYTVVKTGLRSYRHIISLESSRRGLEKILHGSSGLMEQRSMTTFVEGVVMQLRSLIDSAQGLLLCTQAADGAEDGSDIRVLAGAGSLQPVALAETPPPLPDHVTEDIRAAFREKRNVYHEDHCVIVVRSRSAAVSVVYLAGHRPLSDIDRNLLEVFCARVAVGFDNLHLYQQLVAAQRATVHALGKLAEYKDEVTGDHVRRVATLAAATAAELRTRGAFADEIDEQFMETIGLASVLHDVGKVGVPDRVLMKPGPLDPDEMALMRTHAEKGGTILREAASLVEGHSYLSVGAAIAESHHEKFDGTGYPHHLSGDSIPLAGRIVAVVDVYDALVHERPYKAAWSPARALDLIREEAGRHFDPAVAAAFLTVMERRGLG